MRGAHGERIFHRRVFSGRLGGKLHVRELADAAARSDPQAAFAIFRQGVHVFAPQPVGPLEKLAGSIPIASQPVTARSDPQNIVVIHQQRPDLRVKRKGRLWLKVGIKAMQAIFSADPNLPFAVFGDGINKSGIQCRIGHFGQFSRLPIVKPPVGGAKPEPTLAVLVTAQSIQRPVRGRA